MSGENLGPTPEELGLKEAETAKSPELRGKSWLESTREKLEKLVERVDFLGGVALESLFNAIDKITGYPENADFENMTKEEMEEYARKTKPLFGFSKAKFTIGSSSFSKIDHL